MCIHYTLDFRLSQLAELYTFSKSPNQLTKLSLEIQQCCFNTVVLLLWFLIHNKFVPGLGHEHFWTSGTDQAEEGTFFWMSTGRPVTFTNWNTGEPNNFRYENGEEEHCLELWNRDGKGLKWNDSPCSFETFFVCEVGQ